MRSLPVYLLTLTVGIFGCKGTTEAQPPNDGASAKPDAGETVDPPATKHGFVTVVSIPANLSALAVFRDEPRLADVEGCVLQPWTPLSIDSDAGATAQTRPNVKAGDVAVSLVTKAKGREQRSLAWDPEKTSYSFVNWPGPESNEPDDAWSRLDVAGQRVDVTVTGDVVPAFQASVVASADFDVIGSEPTATQSLHRNLSVSRNGDLALSWTNANAPSMGFFLEGKTRYVSCRFSAPATTGVVPAALFQQLASEAAEDRADCPGSTCLSGHLDALAETHVRAGDFDITVSHQTLQLLELIFKD